MTEVAAAVQRATTAATGPTPRHSTTHLDRTSQQLPAHNHSMQNRRPSCATDASECAPVEDNIALQLPAAAASDSVARQQPEWASPMTLMLLLPQSALVAAEGRVVAPLIVTL